jgi:hypothetical protein
MFRSQEQEENPTTGFYFNLWMSNFSFDFSFQS